MGCWVRYSFVVVFLFFASPFIIMATLFKSTFLGVMRELIVSVLYILTLLYCVCVSVCVCVFVSVCAKAPIHLETLSQDPISSYRKPVKQTSEIRPHHWFPLTTDRIAGLSPKKDQSLRRVTLSELSLD